MVSIALRGAFSQVSPDRSAVQRWLTLGLSHGEIRISDCDVALMAELGCANDVARNESHGCVFIQEKRLFDTARKDGLVLIYSVIYNLYIGREYWALTHAVRCVATMKRSTKKAAHAIDCVGVFY